ncbi:MAG: 50S ribosomal protein L25 [Candidatus Uhrbacteria bacterium]
MTIKTELRAIPRAETGQRSAGRTRASGSIPAIVYGRSVASFPVTVTAADFMRVFRIAGESTLVELAIEGRVPLSVLIHEITHDPVTSAVTHIDFRAVALDEKITTRIPLRFIGEAPAIKLGGVVVRQMDEVEVTARPDALVHEIDVDISALAGLDSAIHVRDLRVPSGVTILADQGAIVVAVMEVRAEEEPTVAPASVESVAVEGKGKEEEGSEEKATTTAKK